MCSLLLPLLCLLLTPPSIALFGFIGRLQSTAVSGRVLCNGIPVPNIRIKLYDTNIVFDTKMAEVRTSALGTFLIAGHSREISNIDPRLYIYHRCNYDGACLKKSEIDIPSRFITDGPVPSYRFDLGPINLNGKFNSVSTDCIN